MDVRELLGLPADASDADVVAALQADPRRAAIQLLGLGIQPLNELQQAMWDGEGRLVGPEGQAPLALTISHLHGTMFLYADLEAMDEPGFPPFHVPVNFFAVGPAPDDDTGERPDLSWVHIRYGATENDQAACWLPDDLELMVPQGGLVPLEDDEPTDDDVEWQ